MNCKFCGNELTDHEDDGIDECRWCNQGWRPSNDAICVEIKGDIQ